MERKLAEASLTAERNRADASRVTSAAEGGIAPYLARENIHLTSMKQIDVYKELAENRNVILCDTEDGDANLVAVAESILADTASLGRFVRSTAMAQLALVHHGSSGLFSRGDDSMPRRSNELRN